MFEAIAAFLIVLSAGILIAHALDAIGVEIVPSLGQPIMQTDPRRPA
jgi:hypothetical protein